MSQIELLPSTSTDQFLAEKAGAIRALAKNVVRDVIEIGRHLKEAKRRVGHGNWLPWLEQEFQWHERTAQRFIQVYDAFGSNTTDVSDLEIPLEDFYKLAAPSTPEAARAEVLERAANGEALSHEQVKEIVDKAVAASREDTERQLAEARVHYAQLIEHAKQDADERVQAVQADLSSKLVLDPDEMEKITAKLMAPLQKKIERYEKRLGEIAEREQKRKEREANKQAKPPIDNEALSASVAIGVALSQLASKLTITPNQMISAEKRCLSATGETLVARIGPSLKHAKAIQSWLDTFIEKATTALE